MRITKSLQGKPSRVLLKGEEEPREGVSVVAREDGLFALRTGRPGRPKVVAQRDVVSIEPLG